MTMQPHPGCTMPAPTTPVNLTALVAANKTAKEAYQAALKVAQALPLAEAAQIATVIVTTTQKVAGEIRMTAAVQDAVALAARTQAQVDALLGIHCPLPDVPDVAATDL